MWGSCPGSAVSHKRQIARLFVLGLGIPYDFFCEAITLETVSAGIDLLMLCREGLDTKTRVIDPNSGSRKLKTLKAFCVFRMVKFLVELGPYVLSLIKSLSLQLNMF